MTNYSTHTFADKVVTIDYSDYNENPIHEWDNLGTHIYFGKYGHIGDEHSYNPDAYDSWEELVKEIQQDYEILIPVYGYSHGGLTISTGTFTCPWDSGQLGFVGVSKNTVRKEYNVKRISAKLLAKIETYLDNEVKLLDDYCTGNVFSYLIEDKEGNLIDSCGGFYGSDMDKNGIKDYLSYYLSKDELAEID